MGDFWHMQWTQHPLEVVALLVSAGVAFGTIALAVVTAVVSIWNRGDAQRSLALQAEDLERRKKANEPNLQMFDQRRESGFTYGGQKRGAFDGSFVIELMNHGRRPALVQSAVLHIDLSERLTVPPPDLEAKQYGSACVRYQELIRFELRSALREWFRTAWPLARQAVKAGETITEEELVKTGRLEVGYSEVDGTSLKTVTFPIDLSRYYSSSRPEDFQFSVVRKGKA